ncbi:aspartate/glutamate racemase family protein [Planomicrobium sp. CPCC 101110]|uniref:aspartate/glutamate racemase family protein n=1 Tax=Planomicrobium sp. CPCC 101110 TaxID=2599619 RepID=UPI0011B76E6D|nr:aspartate/glutamate racemase family protein [Planomicrobium sp. CPCC 101110]TWT25348.1 hydrogenase expression protein HupH [Planomicrobium sp. CPCC 101110]
MKIVYVLPGPISRTEGGRMEMQRRLEVLRSYAAPGTEVDIADVDEGPASIESLYEEYLSIPPTVDLMLEMEWRGYDAAILGCYGDPGLDAVREVTEKMIIVGPGEAGVMAAAMSGYRFSIITVTHSMVNPLHHLVEKAGVGKKLASVRAIEVPVLELAEEREKTVQKLIAEGRRAIKEDRADTLVLGCMSMGFLNAAEEMSEELGVPVINPGKIALKMAEALAGAGVSHSKLAYMTPPKISSGTVKSSEGLLVKKERAAEETQ